MAKTQKPRNRGSKLLALAIIAFTLIWVYVQRQALNAPADPKPQTEYKPDDREKLERLIHEGTKND
jgi:hypothetical protein